MIVSVNLTIPITSNHQVSASVPLRRSERLARRNNPTQEQSTEPQEEPNASAPSGSNASANGTAPVIPPTQETPNDPLSRGQGSFDLVSNGGPLIQTLLGIVFRVLRERLAHGIPEGGGEGMDYEALLRLSEMIGVCF